MVLDILYDWFTVDLVLFVINLGHTQKIQDLLNQFLDAFSTSEIGSKDSPTLLSEI